MSDEALIKKQRTVKDFTFRSIRSDSELPSIIEIVEKDLSEPYSIFTYRYFTLLYPELCIMCHERSPTSTIEEGALVGVAIGRIDKHKKGNIRGYIGMLCVRKEHRGLRLGHKLVSLLLDTMLSKQPWALRDYPWTCEQERTSPHYRLDEIVLEAEVNNKAALRIYESFGFIRDKYLYNYYLNGSDAYRLKLFIEEDGNDGFTHFDSH